MICPVDGLQWLADNQETVLALARSQCRRRFDLVDDLWGEAVDRAPSIAKNFEPALGALSGDPVARHMIVNLRWYFYKWMNKHNRHNRQGVIVDSSYTHDFPDLFAIDLVKNVLSELSDYERSLLLLAHTKDLNYREIGELVGIAKGTARLHCLQALARAKELLHSKNV